MYSTFPTHNNNNRWSTYLPTINDPSLPSDPVIPSQREKQDKNSLKRCTRFFTRKWWTERFFSSRTGAKKIRTKQKNNVMGVRSNDEFRCQTKGHECHDKNRTSLGNALEEELPNEISPSYAFPNTFADRSTSWWMGYLFLRFLFWPLLALFLGWMFSFETETTFICAVCIEILSVFFAVQSLAPFMMVYGNRALKHYLCILFILIIGPCMSAVLVVDYVFGLLYMLAAFITLPFMLIFLLLYSSNHRLELDLNGWKLSCHHHRQGIILTKETSKITSLPNTGTTTIPFLEKKEEKEKKEKEEETKDNSSAGISIDQSVLLGSSSNNTDPVFPPETKASKRKWDKLKTMLGNENTKQDSTSSAPDPQHPLYCDHPYCNSCKEMETVRFANRTKTNWNGRGGLRDTLYKRRCNRLLHNCMVLLLLGFLTSPLLMWTGLGWMFQQTIMGALIGFFSGVFVSLSCCLYLYYLSYEMEIEYSSVPSMRAMRENRSNTSTFGNIDHEYPLLGPFTKQIESGFISLTRHSYHKFLIYFGLITL